MPKGLLIKTDVAVDVAVGVRVRDSVGVALGVAVASGEDESKLFFTISGK
jgi:hypothetical protein